MDPKARTRTEGILTFMNFLTYVVFIGLMIKAGAILISYGVSWVNPVAARKLYLGLDLYNLSQFSFLHYTVLVFFMVIVLIMKAFVCYLVIKTLSGVKLSNPFTAETARLLERISIVLLITWAIALMSGFYTSWLLDRTGALREDGNAG